MKRELLCLLCVIPNLANAAVTDNGDGTVTDTRGLMWLKERPKDPTDAEPGMKTWQQAMLWANGLTFAGHDDWRLPSALEFSTGVPDLVWNSKNNEWGHLYDVEWGNPETGVVPPPMAGYGPGYYWTSTEHPSETSQAGSFYFGFDNQWFNDFRFPKTTKLAYTAVRGVPKPTKAPQCRDGYDNDHNGLVDYPADPGCSSAEDDSEFTCEGMWCFFGRRVPPWRACLKIDDSTICIDLFVPVAVGFIVVGGIWWARRARAARRN